MNHSKPASADAPPRMTVTTAHKGYEIKATASRRATGAVLVNAELSGGPDKIRRWFCVASDRADLAAACAQSTRELCQVIDDLTATGETP